MAISADPFLRVFVAGINQLTSLSIHLRMPKIKEAAEILQLSFNYSVPEEMTEEGIGHFPIHRNGPIDEMTGTNSVFTKYDLKIEPKTRLVQ